MSTFVDILNTFHDRTGLKPEDDVDAVTVATFELMWGGNRSSVDKLDIPTEYSTQLVTYLASGEVMRELSVAIAEFAIQVVTSRLDGNSETLQQNLSLITSSRVRNILASVELAFSIGYHVGLRCGKCK